MSKREEKINPISDIKRNTSEISDILKSKSLKIIGIDGIDGIGKTYLAKEIEKIGYIKISLDDFLEKKSGGYFNFLDLEKINNFIKKNKGKQIAIEGVLLLKVIEKLKLKVDYLIYMTNSIWIYEWAEYFNGKYSKMKLSEIINEVEVETTKLNKILDPNFDRYKMKGFRKEIYEYSFKYKPWGRADIIIQR